MISIRRSSTEPRIELTPMIDVIFLLLTFFIYSMVLMVRVDLLPLELKQFASGTPAESVPASTISIDLAGSLYLDREPVRMDQVLPRLQTVMQAEPDTQIYLAVEDGQGSVDRAPLLQDLWDLLKNTGFEIHFVGRPADDVPAGDGG